MIEKHYYPYNYFLWGIYGFMAWLLITIALPATPNWLDNGVTIAIVVLVMGGGTVVHYLDKHNLKKRPNLLTKLAQHEGYDYELTHWTPELSPNFSELMGRDAVLLCQLKSKGLVYSDYRHTIYKKTKNGEYKAADVYYSLLTVKLPRKLPNVLFDSPKAHDKQFKVYFDRSQVISLEGTFDKHFTAYFAKFYNIDLLSIITPEVMEALVEADQFDVEIHGDKLHLYGPLVPVEYIPEMVRLGLNIKNKLMNNIMTYRDERVKEGKGREEVAIFGAKLRRSPYRYLKGLLAGVALLVGAGVIYYYVSFRAEEFWYCLIGGGALTYGAIAGMRDTVKENRMMDAAYRQALAPQEQEATSSG